MRRIWAAAALLLFVTVICVSGMITLHRRTDSMIAALEDISSSMNSTDRNELMAKAESAKAQWAQWHDWYAMHLQHSHIDQITKAINKIPLLIREDNLTDCQNECIDAILLLNIILKSEQLTPGNIL